MYLGSFLLCEWLSEVTAKHRIAVESCLSVCLSITLVNCGRMIVFVLTLCPKKHVTTFSPRDAL